MSATAASGLKYNPDTGHLVRGGCDLMAIFKTYRDRIVHVHLKNVERRRQLAAPWARGFATCPNCWNSSARPATMAGWWPRRNRNWPGRTPTARSPSIAKHCAGWAADPLLPSPSGRGAGGEGSVTKKRLDLFASVYLRQTRTPLPKADRTTLQKSASTLDSEKPMPTRRLHFFSQSRPLDGTLTLPGTGRAPVAILCHGFSSYNDNLGAFYAFGRCAGP